MQILWTIIIGILAGWIAGVLVKGRGFGLIGDLIVGIIGSFVGSFLFTALGLTAYGDFGSFVMMVIGAVAFLAVIKMIKHA